MIEPFDNEEKERGFQKFMEHFPADADTTLMILKGHLLVEEEINEILAMFVNYTSELESALLTFYQKICLLRALLPADMHSDFYAAEMLNRLRNKIAHNLDPKGLNDSIGTFLTSSEIECETAISAEDIRSKLTTALCRLHSGICAYKYTLQKVDLRTFKMPKND